MNRFAMRAMALGCTLTLLAAAGCVERELFIKSDQPETQVILDGVPRGTAPVRIAFDHYGTRKVELRKAGYEVHTELLELDPPLYQVFPFDFFCEVLIPYTWTDTREVDVRLIPVRPEEIEDEEKILERARELQRST